MRGELPEFREWSVAAVHLLQGVVEADGARSWNLVLSNRSPLESYFARIGLRLVVDETEGYAYLRQFAEEEGPDGYDKIPKLFRSNRLSFGQTLLCVLLRDALRRFEEEEVRDERCVVEESEVLDAWRLYFPQLGDDVKLLRDLQAQFRKLEDLGFVRRFGQDAGHWEVRRILKARLNADQLEHLHEQLTIASSAARSADAAMTDEKADTSISST